MNVTRRGLRDLLDPVPSRARDKPTRNGAIMLAVVLLAVYSAVAHDIPLIGGTPGTTVKADFAATNQVNDRTPVRVDGVTVGTVEDVEAGADPLRESRMTMRITHDDVVVRRDARASIRWRTLLGGSMYVDLEPGSAREPEIGDGVIPMTRTSSQVELDDVLRIYDGGTAAAQRATLRGLSDAFADEDAGGRALEALPRFETVRRGLRPYQGTQAADLRRIVKATATTVEALGADSRALAGLVTGARRTLGATAVRREDLGRFLEQGPATLDSTRVTLTRLRETLDHLDPLVDDLRPGVRRIAPASRATRPALERAFTLLRRLRPVLRDAAPTFDDLAKLGESGVPVLRELEPTVDRLNERTIPYLSERDDSTKLRNLESIGPAFSVLDMGAAEFDREGFRLHLSTPAANNSVITAAGTQFRQTCLQAATRAQRGQCDALSKVVAGAIFGRGEGKGR